MYSKETVSRITEGPDTPQPLADFIDMRLVGKSKFFCLTLKMIKAIYLKLQIVKSFIRCVPFELNLESV